MIKQGWKEVVFNALKHHEFVLLRSDAANYYDDTIDSLEFFHQKFNVVVVTFDTNTRDIAEDLEARGISRDRLFVIDCVSFLKGKGSPPVSKLINIYRPDYFVDIQVYTHLFLKKQGYHNNIVFFLSLHNLQVYQNYDEVGMFLYTFKEFLREKKVGYAILEHTSMDFGLNQVISSYTDKEISVR